MLGVGISLPSWPPSIVGAALALVGDAVGVEGGGLYDAKSSLTVREEMRQVRSGTLHLGTAPGNTIPGEEARRTAGSMTKEARALLSPRPHGGQAWAPVAGVVLVLISVGVIVLQGSLTVPSPTGQTSSLRDTGLAILIGLAGLRIATWPGKHHVAIGVAGVAGLLLVTSGFLAGHTRTSMAVVGVISGAVVVLGALVALGSPDTDG